MGNQDQLSETKKKVVSRREALAKLGKFGVYSTPTIMILSSSTNSFAHTVSATATLSACANSHPGGFSPGCSHCLSDSPGNSHTYIDPNPGGVCPP